MQMRPAPEEDKPAFDAVPPRQRKPWRRIFNECGAIAPIERQITQGQLVRLFRRMLDREERIASGNTALNTVADQHLPSGYRRDYHNAFLGVIDRRVTDAENRMFAEAEARLDPTKKLPALVYSDFVASFDNYRLNAGPLPRISGKKDSLIELFASLDANGVSARALGERNAEVSIMQMVQVLYGRYSYDRRFTSRAREQTHSTPNDPRPSLAQYTHRRNLRDDLLGSNIIDPAVGVYTYLKIVFGNDEYFNAWTGLTKPLYDKQTLLMPGIDQINQAARDIDRLGAGSIDHAVARLRDDYHFWRPDDIESITPDDRSRYQNYFLATVLNPTASMLSAAIGNYFLAGDVATILSLNIAAPIHPEEVISHDWRAVETKWDIQNALAKKPKSETKPKEAKIKTRVRREIPAIEQIITSVKSEIKLHKKEEKKQKAEIRREERRIEREAKEAATQLLKQQWVAQIPAGKEITERKNTKRRPNKAAAADAAREKARLEREAEAERAKKQSEEMRARPQPKKKPIASSAPAAKGPRKRDTQFRRYADFATMPESLQIRLIRRAYREEQKRKNVNKQPKP